MIFIDRYRLDSNGIWIRPSLAWFDLAAEKTRAAMGEGRTHEVTDLYRHDEVKKALEELFHRKCAYCEQPLGEEWDVEHYRPKGGVAENAEHPGYYWLAYSWANLYPSCKFCNQRRKDSPTWSDPTTLPPAGKFDQFPLRDEGKRAADHLGMVDAEEPLLLDPCGPTEQHEMRFIFDIQGGIEPVLVSPKDRRAEETIRICNLGRRRLREQRADVVKKVARIVSLLDLADSTGAEPAVSSAIEQLLHDESTDRACFAATARYVIRNRDVFAGLG